MKSAAIYARYSSDRQRDVSIDDQIRVCREYCEREGYRVSEVYADRAISGRSTEKRLAFVKMISEAERYDAVVVYKMDRFARNRYHAAIYKEELRKAGVRLISATELIPEGADGILMESLLEAMAEYYSINLSQNIRRGLEGNALRCHHNGIHLYGYTLERDGTYGVHPEESAVVRRIFEEYAAGQTLKEIVEDLAPYKTRRGKPFSVPTVSKMLQNDKYIGVYHFKDHIVPDGMPAIVDEDLFARVQRRKRMRTRKRNQENAVDYLLTGKLFDPENRPYVGVSGKSHTGRKYSYYRCRATKKSWAKDDVEEAVARAVQRLMAAPNAQSVIVEMVKSGVEKANAADLQTAKEMEGRIAEIDRERERLFDLATQLNDTSRVAKKMNELDEEQDSLKDELAELKSSELFITEEHVRFFLQKAAELRAPDSIVSALVARAVLHDDGMLEVFFILKEDTRGEIAREWEMEGPSWREIVGLQSGTFSEVGFAGDCLTSTRPAPGKPLNGLWLYPIRGGFCVVTKIETSRGV